MDIFCLRVIEYFVRVVGPFERVWEESVNCRSGSREVFGEKTKKSGIQSKRKGCLNIFILVITYEKTHRRK